ncbi:MAG: hypothetical protein M1128_02265 [Candidatus Marsarchaeota archaeon]|nr:hypothetical protein [Candidatus Marsarchaeota archaeon]
MIAQIGFSVMISLVIAIMIALLIYGLAYRIAAYTASESAKIFAYSNHINRLMDNLGDYGQLGYYFGG